jgi:hypothetical protein
MAKTPLRQTTPIAPAQEIAALGKVQEEDEDNVDLTMQSGELPTVWLWRIDQRTEALAA